MPINVKGRAPIRGRTYVGKTLLVPAALAVTAIAAACGDDDQKQAELPACSAVVDAGTCQPCMNSPGRPTCVGPQPCVFDELRGVCEQAVA